MEAVRAAHPGVHEIAVCGEPDPVRDEVPVAHVVVRADAKVSPEDLIAFAEKHLAPAKRPRRVCIVHDLPRTSVVKIRRFLLRPPTHEG